MNTRQAVRLPAVVLAAVLVNALMFGVIQYMVVDREMRLADTADFEIANFIRVQEQQRAVRSRRDPKAPEKPSVEAQKELHRLASAPTGGAIGSIEVSMPKVDIAIDTGGKIAIARELTPLVRVPPSYPERAAANKTEGFVEVRFTVTETGSVADPEVVRSVPPGYFDRAAIRAILKWKYQPQLADGKPVSVISYTRIVFKIEPTQQGRQ